MTTVSATVEYFSKAIDSHDFGRHKKPLIFGVSGPQGSGKSYVSDKAQSELQGAYPHLTIAQFSMDDLYLTHSQQAVLTEHAKREDNPLLQGRGLPGTHDVELGVELLQQIIKTRISGELKAPVKIPVYDKSLFAGEGDRLDSSKWHVYEKPIDVVIFEGWFNGFQPLDPDQLRIKYLGSENPALKRIALPKLEEINCELAKYTKIWNLFDKFVFLQTSSIDNVYTWRLQQESHLIALRGTGMTDPQVIAFVDRYMPAYAIYYENMCSSGVCKAPNSNLRLVIDSGRNLLSTSLF